MSAHSNYDITRAEVPELGTHPPAQRKSAPALPGQRGGPAGPARHLDEKEELWGLCGLLHDLDAESHPDRETHTHHTVRVLRERGVAASIVEAIRLHNEAAHREKRSTLLQHAQAAGETVTGLITASAGPALPPLTCGLHIACGRLHAYHERQKGGGSGRRAPNPNQKGRAHARPWFFCDISTILCSDSGRIDSAGRRSRRLRS